MKICLVQYNPSWEDKTKNRDKIDRMLQKVDDVDLLVFPEMTLTGFTMKSRNFAEDLKGESFNYFAGLAKQFNTNVIAGLIEIDSGDRFNTLIHLDKSGNLKALYHKIHPFSYSEEDKNYSAGDKPSVTEIDGWKTGLSICYDLRFPELYRIYARERVHLIIVIANWPDTRIEHWRSLLKARAIENQCFVIGVNRVGTDIKLTYNGYSGI
ncbi:MAG: nitrilase-related carbon-nitrogen hydrolase, partial [Ignavibacteria bacterium]